MRAAWSAIFITPVREFTGPDLLLSAGIGWMAFAAAASRPLFPALFVCAAVSVFALYRGLCFLHEISHIKRNAVRGFETAWNLLIGFPLLMPSFVYVGVHQSHHSLGTLRNEAGSGIPSFRAVEPHDSSVLRSKAS